MNECNNGVIYDQWPYMTKSLHLFAHRKPAFSMKKSFKNSRLSKVNGNLSSMARNLSIYFSVINTIHHKKEENEMNRMIK